MKKLIAAFLTLSFVAFSSIPVVTLKTREHKILVKNTANGNIYSVFDKSGKELAKERTLEELQAQDASLAEIVKKAIAAPADLHAEAFSHGNRVTPK